MFEVKTEQYSGPLGKLLELIEEKKLEVTTVSLAEVTADFIAYVRSLEDNQTAPRILADFLVVAARLILIKSKVLLPSLELTGEEEEDIYDLEHRLRLYKEFKGAAEHVRKLWDNKEKAYSRELFLHLGSASANFSTAEGISVFYPPPELDAGCLQMALAKIISALKELKPEKQKIRSTIITIEAKIKELLSRFTEAVSQSFNKLSSDKPRSEMIVLFLAILLLFKNRIGNLEQSSRFGDIIISKLET